MVPFASVCVTVVQSSLLSFLTALTIENPITPNAAMATIHATIPLRDPSLFGGEAMSKLPRDDA